MWGCHAGASDSPVSAAVGGQAQGVMGTGLHECTSVLPVYLQPSSHPQGLHLPTLLPGDPLDPCPLLFLWTFLTQLG